jgi:hypothetical protein
MSITPNELEARVVAELVCPDCPAEVKVTFGARVYARVIHAITCPWHARHQADEPGFYGAIPCGVSSVTHRGPYARPRRDPAGGRA